MRISIGSDHRGIDLKDLIIKILKKKNHKVSDIGPYTCESCDYPDYAFKVANDVRLKKSDRGILICKTGIGNSIAANKVPGVRAALCYGKKAAMLSRLHNDSNVLVLGSDFIKKNNLAGLLDTWLKTEFEAGRHEKRLQKIKEIEKKFAK